MRVVVCGAGNTGRHVATVLSQVHHVTVIERDRARLEQARPHISDTEMPEINYVQGDATDPAVLAEAGARDADVLIAVTRDDPTNLLAALLGKRRMGVRWTVARMVDAAHEWLFTQEAGVDVAVSTSVLVARLVQEEVTAGDLVTLLRLRGRGVAVTETTLPPGATIAGSPASDLDLPTGVVLTAIVRAGEVLLPERAGRLRAGDTVIALCEPGREHALHSVLTGATER